MNLTPQQIAQLAEDCVNNHLTKEQVDFALKEANIVTGKIPSGTNNLDYYTKLIEYIDARGKLKDWLYQFDRDGVIFVKKWLDKPPLIKNNEVSPSVIKQLLLFFKKQNILLITVLTFAILFCYVCYLYFNNSKDVIKGCLETLQKRSNKISITIEKDGKSLSEEELNTLVKSMMSSYYTMVIVNRLISKKDKEAWQYAMSRLSSPDILKEDTEIIIKELKVRSGQQIGTSQEWRNWWLEKGDKGSISGEGFWSEK